MDPYLEEPSGWVTFHNRLIGTLDELLSARLGPDFFVAQQTFVYLIDAEGQRHHPPIAPDLFVADPSAGFRLPAGQVISPPTLVLAPYPERVEQRFLEIRDSRERRLIAVIEVLSPTNKDGGGLRQFDRKRRETMTTSVHWIEIDLLRAGSRFPPAAGASDYCVVLKRGDRLADPETTEFLIWYINLPDRLPTIAVPLTPAEVAVTLDLAAAFELVYGRYYEGRLDYAGPAPPPPLSADQARWLVERLGRWRDDAGEDALR
jgi:uncharacterized protein DUF4058